MPCRTRFTETSMCRSIAQQPGTKNSRSPADKTLMNWSSTARCVAPFGLHRISFHRASEDASRTDVFGSLESKKRFESWAHRPAAVPPKNAPLRPGPPLVARPATVHRPTPSRRWCVRVLESSGYNHDRFYDYKTTTTSTSTTITIVRIRLRLRTPLQL